MIEDENLSSSGSGTQTILKIEFGDLETLNVESYFET